MLFILFNGGGLTDKQWYEFQGKTTNFISRLEKMNLGSVYTYTPNFYYDEPMVNGFIDSGNQYMFRMEDLDLEKHCFDLYEKVKHMATRFFLISHSRGYLYAHVFGRLFSDKIAGYINFDGTRTKEEAMDHGIKFKEKYQDIDAMDNTKLLTIFNELKLNAKSLTQSLGLRKDILRKLSSIVEYFQYREYDKIKCDFKFPVRVLNNIYDDNEINLGITEYVGTTLKQKFLFNRELEKNPNVKSVWYVGKTHWLYVFDDVIDDVIKMISEIVEKNTVDKEILIIRHGETEWNKLGLTQGALNDIELNDNGKDQSKKTGTYLREKRMQSGPFDLIICSPMKRTKETASIIADQIGYDKSKIVYMPQLTEIDQGLLAIGKKTQELKQDPFYHDFFKLMDGYEKLDKIGQLELEDDIPEIFVTKYKMEANVDVIKRVNEVINFIRSTEHKKIIVVTHNGTIGFMNKLILNTVDTVRGDLSKGKNCYIVFYKITNGKFRLIMAPNSSFL